MVFMPTLPSLGLHDPNSHVFNNYFYAFPERSTTRYLYAVKHVVFRLQANPFLIDFNKFERLTMKIT